MKRPSTRAAVSPSGATPLTATFTAAGHRPTTPLAQRSYGVPIASVVGATFPIALNTISVVGFRLMPVPGQDLRPLANRGTPEAAEPVFNASLWMPTAQRALQASWANSTMLYSYAPLTVEGSQTYFQLGADESGTGSRFLGSIYEVAVFAGPLSDADMQLAVDHELLAERGGQFRRNDAPGEVGRPTRRIGQEELHRLAWIGLRQRIDGSAGK